MDLGTGIAIFSGCSVVVAGIMRFVPKKNGKGIYITTREFDIWREGLDQRWTSLEGWISSIQSDVKVLTDKKRTD